MTQEEIFIMFRNMAEIYEENCEPIIKENNIPLISLEILSFLSEYPEHFTAKDICSIKMIKPSLVSLHVEKLVKNGYLVREAVNGDRRKVKLICTEKAAAVANACKEVRDKCFTMLTDGISEEEKQRFDNCLLKISKNAEIIKTKLKGGKENA
ncbi:MAG: winged helix-turn-helix transcriptional regulator [Oscillospiraceae bacterium]|nr:winged helix-turn-helix transcriptional regulator [Oscillospiraceae bacterium]